MGKTINVVYAFKDYKNDRNRLMQAPATINEDGSADVHVAGNPFKRLRREQGEWLTKEEFDNCWHAAIEDIIREKIKEGKNEIKK